jgi:hypothetical protein
MTETSLRHESTAAAGTRPAEAVLARGWRTELLLVGLLITGLTALLPLYDPDLPMHLAIGEWIVRHRALPTVEPFAWTRAGAPFYAYSWLPETTFYLVHRAFGPLGLRLLQGALMLAVGLSTLSLARAARWSTGTRIWTAAFSVLVAALVTPSLRPQIVLLIALPLVWAEMYRLRRDDATGWTIARLVALSALVVNSHLFFAMVLAPVPLLLVDRPARWARAARATGALVAGWLLTPYLLHWPALLRANFAPNAMLASPSPIAELQPGFAAVPHLEVIALPAILLALLPWAAGSVFTAPRHRALAAAYWLVGLVGFAYANRLLLVWWLLVLPFVGAVVDQRAAREGVALPRARFRVPAYALLAVLLVLSLIRSGRAWELEGTRDRRTLATIAAKDAEPLASWLEQHLRPGSTGRLFTVFNFGSYLTWRLPGISPSVDGRTLFPDSVARAEALVVADRRTIPTGPWRSADLAIVPLNRRVAGAIDSSARVPMGAGDRRSGWHRVAIAVDSSDAAGPDTTGLWVRRDWWSRVGRTALPDSLVVLRVRR